MPIKFRVFFSNDRVAVARVVPTDARHLIPLMKFAATLLAAVAFIGSVSAAPKINLFPTGALISEVDAAVLANCTRAARPAPSC